MKLLALLLAAGAFLPQTPSPLGPQRFHVSIVQEDGEDLLTLQADHAPLHDVLMDVVRRSDLSLDGFEPGWRKILVSADLRRRPLRQALSYLMGSVGLSADVRQGAIVLREGLESSTEEHELYDAAIACYLRVLRQFPEHPRAPEAELLQATIEERRGRTAAARARLDTLIEQYPESELVPGAMYRSGLLSLEAGAWDEAVQRFSDLLRVDRPHDYEVRARLELAWCVAQLGQHERALYMVEALDQLAPPADSSEERRRAFVRIRALAGLGQGKQALTLLDDLDARLGSAEAKSDSLELRALACEAAARPADAARAWLARSQLVAGSERERALREAARLALANEQELGSLFVAELAKDLGIDLGDVAREARARLTLDDNDLRPSTLTLRLSRAERLLDAGLSAEALSVLHTLEPQFGDAQEPLRVRLHLTLGRALAKEAGVDTALEHFRNVLPTILDPERRREIYVLAGDLLDEVGRLDNAIEAYRGRL